MNSILLLLVLTNLVLSQVPVEVIIGTEGKEFEVTEECQQFQVATNFKRVKIAISNLKNFDRILITDKLQAFCNSKECPSDSNICEWREIENSSEITFDTRMCVEKVYVTLHKSFNPTAASDGKVDYSFDISADYVKGENCEYVHQNPSAYCAESNLDDCRSCKRLGCTILQCGTQQEQRKELNNKVELCIPTQTSDKEKLEKCQDFRGIQTFSTPKDCTFDDLEGYSTFTIFLISFIVIVVLVFAISVIYYNIYLIKYGSPPFPVHDMFPEFLFPRKSEERNTLGDKLDDVFATDNRQNFN